MPVEFIERVKEPVKNIWKVEAPSEDLKSDKHSV